MVLYHIRRILLSPSNFSFPPQVHEGPSINDLRQGLSGGVFLSVYCSSQFRESLYLIERNELVGFGVAIEKQPPRYRKVRLKTLSVTLSARTEQNPFSAELAVMAYTLKTLVGLKDYNHTDHEQ